ncbi:MAG TPA: MFS transporter [Vicinamibacterales bacterium]|nr:MFS transporter [Vicinamibacterales bacterium]
MSGTPLDDTRAESLDGARGTPLGGAQGPRLLGLHPAVLVLASTHFLVDGFGNIFAPLLPLLIPRLGLSLAAAGTVQMLYQMANSVSQLGFGHLADRWRPRVLLLAGPLLAVSVVTLIGFAQNVWTLAAALIVGGLGAAAFHPPAAALVHRYSGERRGLSMSFHITSGTLGQAMAPLVFAPVAQHFGLAMIPALMIPGLAVVGLLLLPRIPRIDQLRAHHEPVAGFSALRPYARPLALLYFIVVLRTMTANAFSVFTPTMLVRHGMSVSEAGTVTFIFLTAVGAGGFFGGPLADRFGPRKVIILSLLSAVPFLFAAPHLTGRSFTVVLAAGGFLLQSTLPVNVTFGQTLAPISAATVSSLMMGFAWGMAGLNVPLAGMLGDRIGIERMLMVMSFLPMVATLLALPLPGGGPAHTPSRGSESIVPEVTGTDVAD